MPRYAKVDPESNKITEIRSDEPPQSQQGEWQQVADTAKVGDDAGEHPQGGPPGQTGEHPQGGAPGQNKPKPEPR